MAATAAVSPSDYLQPAASTTQASALGGPWGGGLSGGGGTTTCETVVLKQQDTGLGWLSYPCFPSSEIMAVCIRCHSWVSGDGGGPSTRPCLQGCLIVALKNSSPRYVKPNAQCQGKPRPGIPPSCGPPSLPQSSLRDCSVHVAGAAHKAIHVGLWNSHQRCGASSPSLLVDTRSRAGRGRLLPLTHRSHGQPVQVPPETAATRLFCLT